MKKAVLISIQPQWVEKIAQGKKTIEVRKKRPDMLLPFKCYIYCTYGDVKTNYYMHGRGKVIGEFVCDRIYTIFSFANGTGVDIYENFWTESIDRGTFFKEACLTEREIARYLDDNGGYGWYISNLKIYDKPKALSEFYARCKITESKCKLCDNCYERQDYYGRHYAVKKLTRPPISWCYVEEL